MRILYGITKSNFGGAQRYVYDLALESRKLGHEVAVLCGGSDTLVAKLCEANIKVFPLEWMGKAVSPFDDSRSFFSIMETISEWEPDVFHINSSKMGGIGALAGRLMQVKRVVFTAHGWAFNEPRPAWQKPVIKLLAWLTMLLAHRTVCVSEGVRRDVGGFPFIQGKLALVRNGVRAYELRPRAEAREAMWPGIGDDELLVASLSELHPVKGLDVLLEAWHDFMKAGRKAKLVLMGRGEEKGALELFAKELGIEGSVRFMGYVDNARALLSGADILVMPSRSEALPYAPIEAGFAAVPVLATNVGGIPEIVEDGRSGILVPREDHIALHDSLDKLAGDSSLRAELGNNLKRAVEERFDLDKMVEETLRLYQ